MEAYLSNTPGNFGSLETSSCKPGAISTENNAATRMSSQNCHIALHDINSKSVSQNEQMSLTDGKIGGEPPMKKLKQDSTEHSDNSVITIREDKDIIDNSNGQMCECNKANTSPPVQKNVKLQHHNSCEKDKISPPKHKRRKLTNEEKEALQKQKEEARLAKEKLLLEKELERKKKEKEKEELRQKKEKERLEKQIEKELKEKEKQARKDQLEKERLEKQKKKEEMLQVKDEERKKKEEERKQKEEEKKQKDEERRQREEEKRQKEEEEVKKKEKAKEAFRSFFIKKTPPKKIITLGDSCELFAPFELKSNMTLAPLHRKVLEDKCIFDTAFLKQEEENLYLSQLKSKHCRAKAKYVTSRSLRLTKEQTTDEDIVILKEVKSPSKELPVQNTMRTKLLQFSENNRPAYYGTWRKHSKFISPKNPFKKDENHLNYEIDSDDEWEEEEPGESLSGPENDEEDEEEDNDDEDDDGFFVPHGYLSDDEGIDNSDGEGKEKVDIKDQKLNKTNGFPFDKKNKVKQLRATCFGSSWLSCSDNVPDFLTAYKVCPFVDVPFDVFEVKLKEDMGKKSSSTGDSGGYGNRGSIPMRVPEEAMPFLIHHVHQNSMGVNRLITSFLEFWKNRQPEHDSETSSQISKRQLERKILEIAKRETLPENSKSCYIVQKDYLDKYEKEMDHIKATNILNNTCIKNTSPLSQNPIDARINRSGENSATTISGTTNHANVIENEIALQNSEHFSSCNKLERESNSEMMIIS